MNNQADPDYNFEDEIKYDKPDLLENRYSFEYMTKVKDLCLKYNNIAKAARELKINEDLAKRIKNRALEGPTDSYKLLLLKEKLKIKFIKHRDLLLPVHNRTLDQWINELKIELGITKFKLTTNSFKESFKREAGNVAN